MADTNAGIWVLIGAGLLGGFIALMLKNKTSTTTSTKGCSACQNR